MSNLETLKKGYQLFAEGKMEEVLAMWDDNIVWEACANLPYINGDGVFRGKPAILEGVFAHLPAYYNNFNIEIREFVNDGDKIVMVGRYTGEYKPTGKPFDVHATHTWTYENGKVVNFFQAVDTAGITQS